MENQDLGNKNNNSSSYLCRQSSSRWTPTSDQIRILKELYYNNGIRSPTADQIQRIAARLRHYGKIEGKNVFYWFQNHKARERQKKRLTPPADHHHNHHHHMPYFYNHQQLNIHAAHHLSPPAENAAAASSSSLQPFIPVGCAYGSIAMEKSFRECWVSSGGESRVPGEEMHNLGSWVGNRQPESDETADEESGEMETLPLFPIHHEIINSVSNEEHSNDESCYTSENWLLSEGRTSLELTLNSYHYYHN